MNKNDTSVVWIDETATSEKTTVVKCDRPGFSRWKWLVSQWVNDLKTLLLSGSEPQIYWRRDRNISGTTPIDETGQVFAPNNTYAQLSLYQIPRHAGCEFESMCNVSSRLN